MITTPIKVTFLCRGNICRSKMAENVFRNIVKTRGFANLITIDSFGTSNEEEGNPIYPEAKAVLKAHDIEVDETSRAKQITLKDYEDSNIIVAMDCDNVEDLCAMFKLDEPNKVHYLMSFANIERDVLDPWYTRDFETAYQDINDGCWALFDYLTQDREGTDID